MKKIRKGLWMLLLTSPLAYGLELPLFRAYPTLSKIPRLEILKEFTPVRSMDKLETYLLGDQSRKRLWVKMDDRSGHLLGGNKSRKLEFILGEAREQKARVLVTSGMWGSNHAYSTAVAAKQFGFESQLILGPQPVTESVRKKLLADRSLGADLKYYGNKLTLGLALARGWIKSRLKKDYFYVPPGGTSMEGSVGYVNAFFELVDQMGKESLPKEIYLPVGTAGTSAGLLVGSCLAGVFEQVKIVGIGISHGVLSNRALVVSKAKKIHEFLQNLNGEEKLPRCDYKSKKAFTYYKDFSAPGYGKAKEEVYSAMDMAKTVEGLKLDGTYSGKAFYAFMLRAFELPKEYTGRIMFWQTYNSHSLDELIAAHPWTDPEHKWKDLPKKFWKLFKD